MFETCVRWVCQREKTDWAWKQENMSKLARQGAMGAQRNPMEHQGEVLAWPGGFLEIL